MPAIAALGVNIIDIGTHCWELAQATGQELGPSAEAIAAIDGLNRQIVSDQVRSGGGFGQELEADSNDPLAAMLAFVGRRA